jgi:2-hydroxyglutarate dehydrogenase
LTIYSYTRLQDVLGIVDWGGVAQAYGRNFKSHGGSIHLGFNVKSIRATHQNSGSSRPITIQGQHGNQVIECDYVLTCGGLQSDRIAALTGCSSEPKIVPFRGEYLLLSKEKSQLIKGNIYPVPDPAFPFLGVHFTPRLNGEVSANQQNKHHGKTNMIKWLDP